MQKNKPADKTGIICACSGTTRWQLGSLLADGVDDLDRLSRITGACSGCGGCESDVLAFLAEKRAPAGQ